MYWFAPVTSYYKDYQRRYGVWEGIDRVPTVQARRMQNVLAFTTTGAFGPPLEVRALNGSGSCPRPFQSLLGNVLKVECTPRKACSASFEYAANGSIAKEHLEDQFGAPLEG
mgnify:CR=1 FL=1